MKKFVIMIIALILLVIGMVLAGCTTSTEVQPQMQKPYQIVESFNVDSPATVWIYYIPDTDALCYISDGVYSGGISCYPCRGGDSFAGFFRYKGCPP